MDHPNEGGDHGGQFPAQDDENFDQMLERFFGPDSLNPMNFHNPQAWNLGNQSVPGTEQPALGASYSMDQFRPPPASRTQLLENQMPAEILSIWEQLDAAAGVPAAGVPNWLERKRASGRKHCQKKKETTRELTSRNQELHIANQVKDQLLNELRGQMEDKLQKEQQQLKKIAKAEAEIEHLKKQHDLLGEKYLLLEEKLKETSREKNQLHQKMKNLTESCIEKPKKKLKKQVAGTAEETQNDN